MSTAKEILKLAREAGFIYVPMSGGEEILFATVVKSDFMAKLRQLGTKEIGEAKLIDNNLYYFYGGK